MLRGLTRPLLRGKKLRIAKAFSTTAAKVLTSSSSTPVIKNSLKSSEGAKKPFVDVDGHKRMTWYTCGPTVYEVAHLGHARAYVHTDIIRRILLHHFGYDLNFAMGITDVDDKILAKAREKNMVSWNEVNSMTQELESSFLSDLKGLNVLAPNATLRVTEHIPEIIAYVTRLIELKHAYVASDGVYFDVTTLGHRYDKFGCVPGTGNSSSYRNNKSNSSCSDTISNNTSNTIAPNIEDDYNLNNGIALDATSPHKKDRRDFALWKLAPTPFEQHQHQQSFERGWESPWGWGFPGWHIECSAMTHSYFGDELDVHSGGVDLMFPHHTNEIAQCEAHNCRTEWARFWVHTGHLFIAGRKMSKSLKNFITIEEYFKDSNSNYPGDDFRIFCLHHKYDAALNYAPVRLEEAAAYRSKVQNLFNYINALHDFQAKCSYALQVQAQTYGNRFVGSFSNSSSKKPTEASRALFRLLSETKYNVDLALADDFDTPKVMASIASLVGASHGYISLLMKSCEQALEVQQWRQQNHKFTNSNNDSGNISGSGSNENSCSHGSSMVPQQHPMEPLYASTEYVVRILHTLGLSFASDYLAQGSSSSSRSSSSSSSSQRSSSKDKEANNVGSSTDDSSGVSDAECFVLAVEESVAFRAHVRKACVDGLVCVKNMQKELIRSPPTDNSNNRDTTSTNNDILKEELEKMKATFSDTLQQSDNLRDCFKSSLGITIEDIGKGASKWSKS